MDAKLQDALQRIGRNMRAERSRADLSQEKLARKASLSHAQVARMERGEMDSGISKYVRVATALGVDAGLFFQDVKL